MTKLEKLKNEILGQPKNWKYVKKMFLAKFWAKINFWRRNLSFQSHSSPQNIKNFAVNNMATSRWSKIEKHTDHFYIFSVPGRPIRGHQWIDLDLSYSELFFRVPCDSYSVPNDLIRFFNFGSFFTFWCFSHFSIFLNLWEFNFRPKVNSNEISINYF